MLEPWLRAPWARPIYLLRKLQRLPDSCGRSRRRGTEAACSWGRGYLVARNSPIEVLRLESGPIESLSVENQLNVFHLLVRARRDMPLYTLRGYRLRGVLYSEGDIPVEQQEAELPETAPGGEVKIEIKFRESGVPLRVRFDVFRPCRFSVFSLEWKP